MTRLRPARLTVQGAAFGAGLLALAAGLSGCVGLGTLIDLAVPTPVAGLKSGGWSTLPLRAWVSRDGIRAEAMTGCVADACDQRLAVGVFTASGQEARRLAAVLDQPARLQTLLSPGAGKQRTGRTPVPLSLTAARIGAGALRGFLSRISRGDGSRTVAMAALGTRGLDPLRFVLVVGDEASAVERTAREVAVASLDGSGSSR